MNPIVYRWEVSVMATHPTRPALKTQVSVVVQASDREEALNRASFAVVRIGWNPPGEVVSAVRRFKVSAPLAATLPPPKA